MKTENFNQQSNNMSLATDNKPSSQKEVEIVFEDGIKIGVSHGLNGGEDVIVTSRRPITQGTEVMSVAWKSGGE